MALYLCTHGHDLLNAGGAVMRLSEITASRVEEEANVPPCPRRLMQVVTRLRGEVLLVGAREHHTSYLRTAALSVHTWCEYREVRTCEPRHPA